MHNVKHQRTWLVIIFRGFKYHLIGENYSNRGVCIKGRLIITIVLLRPFYDTFLINEVPPCSAVYNNNTKLQKTTITFSHIYLQDINVWPL